MTNAFVVLQAHVETSSNFIYKNQKGEKQKCVGLAGGIKSDYKEIF